MRIIKRSGMEVEFDLKKIESAVSRANVSVEENERLTEEQLKDICDAVQEFCQNMSHSPNVEEIQDLVEQEIMMHQAYAVAKNYITYRYKRALVRKANSTDQQILSLLECNNILPSICTIAVW